ncbi:MAG TPA: hypothetical protein PLJ60_08275 [Chryseolinea sp.]|nr:hypothetical protein [Chryseolinea sp.]HPH45661.1 hypothetical protein [Chryseolinea sp.]HPM30320.1 hypothetical protein [Chryseolinea sp.]
MRAFFLLVAITLWGCDFEKSQIENINKRLEIANQYGNKKEFVKAINTIDRIIQDYPQHVQPYYYKATYLALLTDKKNDAVKTLDKAIALYPKYAEAFRFRSTLKTGLDALADVDKAIELNPKFGDAFYTRAQLKFGLYDFEGALDDFDKAIKYKRLIHKDFIPGIYTHRALTKMNLSKYKEALVDINIAIQLDSLNPMNYRLRSACYGKAGLFDLADKDYAKSFELGIDSMTTALGVDTMAKLIPMR